MAHALALAVLLGHVLRVADMLAPGDLAGARPILDHDYAFHYANTIEAVEMLGRSGRAWGYDPRFMAGWPAGAILEVDNHPFALAALLLGPLLGIGRAFNLAVLGMLAALPFAVAAGARRLGLAWPLAATAAAVIVNLDPLFQSMTGSGMLAFEIGIALAPLAAGVALAFAEAPTASRLALLAVALSAVLFAHPAAALAAAPPIAVAVTLGALAHPAAGRARALGGFAIAAAAAALANAVWMAPLAAFLPLKEPSRVYLRSSATRALLDYVWQPETFARRAVVLVALVGLAAAAGGGGRGRRAAAVVAAGIAANALFGYAGSYLGPIGELEPARFLAPMMLFAAVAAPWGLERLARPPAGAGAYRRLAPRLVLVIAMAVPMAAHPWAEAGLPGLRAGRFQVRLVAGDDEVVAWAASLRGWGRLLVDDPGKHGGYSSWTHLPALLPHWSGREVLAAHTATVPVRHARTLLVDGVLAGRPIGDWSDAELEAHLRRYGVRWVLAGNDATRARLRRLPSAREVAQPGTWVAFATRGGGPFLAGGGAREGGGPDADAAGTGEPEPSVDHAGRVAAELDRLRVDLVGPGPWLLKYRCLSTLAVLEPGLRLWCAPVEGDPVGFLALARLSGSAGGGEVATIVNRGLGSLGELPAGPFPAAAGGAADR